MNTIIGSRKQSGFTIVELLIVIVVIGILAAIVIVAFNGVQTRASEAMVQSDLRQAATQLSSDNVTEGEYPTSASAANEGKGLASNSTVTFQYFYSSTDNSYCLTATSSRKNVEPYMVTSDNNAPRKGTCPGYVTPGGEESTGGAIAESCFQFSNGEITDYYGVDDRSEYNPDFPYNSSCPLNVVIPSTIGGTPVTSIGYYAFAGDLTSVVIPNTVTSIDTYAFLGASLGSVTIPNSVTSLGGRSFHDSGLTSLTLSNSLASIPMQAFWQNKLTTIAIPNSVTTIESGAFENNELTSITIPNTVTSIGDNGFRNNNLTSVSLPQSTTIDEGEWSSSFDEGTTINRY